MNIIKNLLNKKFIFIFLVGFIVLIFLITRLYNFENRFTFDQDQEEAANAAWRIIVDKRPMLIGQETSTGNLFVGPFLWWFQSIGMFLGNLNPLSLGYQSVVIAFANLVLIFFVVSEISDKWRGLLAAFLYTISSRLASYDVTGQARSYIMIFPLIIFWLLVKIFVKKKYHLMPLLFLTISLTLHVHLALIIFLPITVVLIVWHRPKIKFKYYILSAILFTLPLTTFVLFDLRHSFLLTHSFLNFISTQSPSATSNLATSTLTYFDFLVESTFIKSSLSKLIFILAIGLFIFLMLRSNQKKLMFIFLLIIIFPLFTFSLYKGHIPEYYFLSAAPVFVILVSFVLAFIAKRNKFVFAVLLLLPITINFQIFLTLGNIVSTFKLKEKAIDKIITDTESDSFNVYYEVPLGRNNGFNYLYKWKGKEPQDGGKNLYVIGMGDQASFLKYRFERIFPDKKVEEELVDHVRVISVK